MKGEQRGAAALVSRMKHNLQVAFTWVFSGISPEACETGIS